MRWRHFVWWIACLHVLYMSASVCVIHIYVCVCVCVCQSAHGSAVEWPVMNINQVTEQAGVSSQTSSKDCVMPTPTLLVWMCTHTHTHKPFSSW